MPVPTSPLPSGHRPGPPQRRPQDPGFFGSREGRRVVIFALGFLALLLTLLSTFRDRAGGGSSESRPDTRAAGPENAPKSYLPSHVVHLLRTAEDGAEVPLDSALGAVAAELATTTRPAESQTADAGGAPREIVDLDIREALLFPDAFRGGWVRARGTIAAIGTRGLDHPAAFDGVVFRGWIKDEVLQGMVAFDTAIRFPEMEKLEAGQDEVEVEGVFLQNILYRSTGGKTRQVPLLAASRLRVLPPPEPRTTWAHTLFLPLVVVVSVFVAVGWFVLQRKLKHQAANGRYRARPPRPGN